MSTQFRLTPGVVIERIGDDLLVSIPGSHDVVRLSGSLAELVSEAHLSGTLSASDSEVSDSEVSDLVQLGIVSARGLSRRGLVRAGVVGAGAGVAVLALPGVAAASSSSCFSPATFSVGVGLNTGEREGTFFYEYLTVNFDRPDIPSGLIGAIPDGHPGTFTPTSGPTISVLWQANNERFASFIDLPQTTEQEEALRLGSVSFTLDGCSYSGTGMISEE